jgi:hypothetical protein
VKYLDNYITLFASLMTFATITWELVRFRVHTSYYLLSLAVSGISSMAAEVSAKFEIEVFPDVSLDTLYVFDRSYHSIHCSLPMCSNIQLAQVKSRLEVVMCTARLKAVSRPLLSLKKPGRRRPCEGLARAHGSGSSYGKPEAVA